MLEQIEKEIRSKCRALIRQDQKSRYILARYREKFTLRTGQAAVITPFRDPEIWNTSKHFSPYYCLKHSKYLSRVLWQKIVDGSYEPSPAVRIEIPKPTGGFRTIMAFSIPDSAISNLFHRRLRDKNSNQFSPFSYAYFKDRGLFDAVIQLKSYLDQGQCYLVEMDFSKYFDTIEHRYLDHLFQNENFNLSSAEKTVVDALLKHRISDRASYSIMASERREIGVPQGSSVSLFLANLAGHELDRSLERINGRFVRFADDVVVVTNSHSDAVKIINAFEEHCKYSGVSINYDKSEGISLLEPFAKTGNRSFFIDGDDGDEISVCKEFDFLGHKFRRDGILLSTRSIRRTKVRIAKIIYLNLLYPLTKGTFNVGRITGSGFDWDLLNCVNEIRRFIYGNLREDELRRFVSSGTKIRKFRGFMGFCPLIDKIEQFKELDGWMVDILSRALKERYRRISSLGHPAPASRLPNKTALIDGTWFANTSYPTLEPQLPSFAVAWRASRKRFKLQGLRAFDNPSYYSSISGGAAGMFYGS